MSKEITDKETFIANYIDKHMKNHGLPMSLQYYNRLNKTEENAQKAWKRYEKNNKKILCYELDFGDTNLISQNKKDIIDWIESEMDHIDDGGLSYHITTKMLTQKEIDAIPEWQ